MQYLNSVSQLINENVGWQSGKEHENDDKDESFPEVLNDFPLLSYFKQQENRKMD